MCGLVGYVGEKFAKPILLEGLTRLEYRGYDSAGMALYSDKSDDFLVRRCVGMVQGLVEASRDDGKTEHQGIAHTRWATHGIPSETNAHPHRTGRLVLVHNGIIENHADLKRQLQKNGASFSSQTDTEVFARLIETRREEEAARTGRSWEQIDVPSRKKIVVEALAKAMSEVHGHYAILFMVQGLPGSIFGVQSGAPLCVGRVNGAALIASDLQALLGHTHEIGFLPQDSLFEADASGYRVIEAKSKKEIRLDFQRIEWSADRVAKGGHEHFMIKEIYEQPNVVADTMSGRLPAGDSHRFMWDEPQGHEALWRNVHKVVLIGCGTAYHAALVAKYLFEKWARIPVEVDHASEFRYRHPILEPGTVIGVISQSGETADTLAALRLANERGVSTFSICNVPGSTIMRESKYHYPTKAGPEIGVASTKAFTAQLTALYALAQDVARLRGFFNLGDDTIGALARLPHDMELVLKEAARYQKIGAALGQKKALLLVGRGPMYPIALEGALKIKEITYTHAEAYAAGELKHGPIALIDKDVSALVLAPPDELMPKTLSNLEEIKARRAHIVGIGQTGSKDFAALCDEFIGVPKISWGLAPALYVVPLQLIAYGMAHSLGREIDKPRNLAKSVTVE